MERNRTVEKPVVHCSQYMNKTLCGCIMTPFAKHSTCMNEITCAKCKRIAKAWEEQRYTVYKLRLVK